MTDIPDELVERMVNLVRDMEKAPTSPGFAHYDWARRIAADLPKPIDPDLIEARKIAEKESTTGACYTDGKHDVYPMVSACFAAIKRGRELAGESK